MSELDKSAVDSEGERKDRSELTPDEVKELEVLLEKENAPQVVRSVLASFEGPIPPPSILEGYNGVVQNGAERIVAMVESQQAHRQYIEKTAMKGHINLDRRGQYLAFLVAISFLVGSIYLIASGFVVSGTIFGTVDLVGLVTAFIYGRKASPPEDDGE